MITFSRKIAELTAKAFNTSILEKSRMAWVDYLRGIVIILVVYRHSLVGIERSGILLPSYLVNANMIFYSFRMPLFFIVSGLFISGSLARKNVKQLIGIKFENLIYPYLVWATIQITLQIIFSQYANSDRGWKYYMLILYQPRGLDQFWYLPALFNVTIIYLIVKTRLGLHPISQIILGLVLYFLSPFCRDISIISDWMEFYFFFALGDVISTFFFKDSTQRFFKNKWNLILMIPVFILTQMFYLMREEEFFRSNIIGEAEFLLIALIGCFSITLLAFRLQSLNILSFLRVLGYHSLYIYVIHVLVISFTRLIISKLFGIYNPEILLLSCILMGVTFPVVFYNLLVKDNIAWFLFSYRKTSTSKDSSGKLQVAKGA